MDLVVNGHGGAVRSADLGSGQGVGLPLRVEEVVVLDGVFGVAAAVDGNRTLNAGYVGGQPRLGLLGQRSTSRSRTFAGFEVGSDP